MPDAVPPSPSRAIGPLFALFPFLRPYAGRWALAFLALVTSAGATLALPVAFKYLIDRGFAAGDRATHRSLFPRAVLCFAGTGRRHGAALLSRIVAGRAGHG